MNALAKTLGIDRLNIEERLALVEDIWDSICVDAKSFPMTDAQRVELGHRIADDDANPEDVVPAEQVYAEARARLDQ